LTILTRYTLKQIWIPALMAAVVISFVVALGTIGQEISNLMEQLPIAHVRMVDISLISLYSLPTLAGFIFPITFLLGIMLAFGRMAQASELIVAKAAGIPLRRMIRPVLVAGLVLSGLCFLVLDQLQPIAFQRLTKLVGSDMPHRITFDVFPTGVMHEFGDWRVYIERRSPDKTLHNIIVLTTAGDGVTAYYAESARQFNDNGVVWVEMNNVEIVGEGPTMHSGRITKTLPTLGTLSREGLRRGWSLARLVREERRESREFAETGNFNTGRHLLKIRRDAGDRIAFPLMCLAVSIVAAPIGARASRSGRSFTFASGVIIVAVYFLLRSMLQDIPPPSLGAGILIAQLPNLVLIAVGLVLTWRVDRV
jgi:lipopolysaccharide export LptBFGC system permease protein LptF